MICDKVKECAGTIRHLPVTDGSKKKKGKKRTHNGRRREDAHKEVLSKPPCRSTECQKKCIAFFDNRTKPKCDERGKTYILDQSAHYPPYEVLLFHIDGGVISGPEANTINKCDYALLIKDSGSLKDGKGTAILVELKGVDVRHAYKQLLATLKQEELQPLWDRQRRIYGRIVCRSMPPRIRNTEECMQAKAAFRCRHGNVKVWEEDMVEKFEELDCMEGV